MEHITEILEWISKKNNSNLSLKNFVEENPVYSAKRVGDSVLIRGLSDHQWTFIDSENEEELRQLKKYINETDRYFAAIQSWMLPIINEDRVPIWRLKAYQYILREETEINYTYNIDKNIVPLSSKDAKFIHCNINYKESISVDYIKERIIKSYSAGIYDNDQLVAWILTHDDGSVGFLHVLESYRRRGYGIAVASKLINKLRKNAKQPFLYITDPNRFAAELFSKLGFEKTVQMNWFKIN